MRFTESDLFDVSEALRYRRESIEDSVKHMDTVQAALLAGQNVWPFAPGDAGVKAAKQVQYDLTLRLKRIDDLIERIDEEMYGDEADDE